MNNNNKRFESSRPVSVTWRSDTGLRAFMFAVFVMLAACGGGGEPQSYSAQPSGTTSPVTSAPNEAITPTTSHSDTAANNSAGGSELPGVILVAVTAGAVVEKPPSEEVAGGGVKDIEPASGGVKPEAEAPPPVIEQPFANVTKVRVTPTPIELGTVGATLQLKATAYDAQGKFVTGVPFVWSTDDALRVEVTPEGLITAKSEGVGKISAQVPNGVVDIATVHIKNRGVRVTITPDTWPTEVSYIGARRQFSAEVRDGSGNLMPDAVVTWESTHPQLVHVDDSGLATAWHRSTTRGRIIARVDGASDEVEVSVWGEGSNAPGYMYTAWFARTDPTPMLVVNGRLTVPVNEAGGLEFYGNISYIHATTPVWPHNTVEKFEFEGNRIGLLTDVANGVGTLRIFDRAAEMTILSMEAIDFDLEGNRIALLSGNGRFRVKEGTHGPWTELAESGVVKFVLKGGLIGVLYENGSVRVKDGVHGPWFLMADGNATDFALAENHRVVVLRNDGVLRAKDGLDSAMTDISAHVANFKISNNRIAAVLETGEMRAKDGIHGQWFVLTSTAPRQYEVSGNRIGVLNEAGELRAKDGISGAWVVLAATGTQEFQFQGDRIGAVTAEGRLRIKAGLHGGFTQTPPYASGISQFRLIVDNPVPPKRTTPASYSVDQARCRNATSPDCYHVSDFAVPVPYYGFFCGRGRPENGSEGMRDALALGSIDSLDEMCAHHDNMSGWYAQAYPDDVNPWNVSGSCIVRFGLRHGRLTSDGATLATGYSDADTWREAWSGAGMVNLKGGLDNFFIYTDGCGEGDLQTLDEWTDAQND